MCPPTHRSLGSSLSKATSDDFSNMSANNSTLMVAGSVIGSMGVDGCINRVIGEEYDQFDGMLHPSLKNYRSVKEEVESNIIMLKNAKIAEITNRFKCEDAIIQGWESEQTKLEEKKARAMEKMENEIAKAHQKAEERRASA